MTRSQSMSAGMVQRARIVLLASEGRRNGEIAELAGASRPKVNLWPEFLPYLKQVERACRHVLDADGQPVELHLVMDNYAAHKHKNIRAWLADNPRFTVHFTPHPRLVDAWWKSSSASSNARPSAAESSPPSTTSTRKSAPSSTAGTTASTSSSGPKPPKKSSQKPTVKRLQIRTTSAWTA